jgi:hypothetical protein
LDNDAFRRGVFGLSNVGQNTQKGAIGMIGAVILTIWYCHATDPFCTTDKDPMPAYRNYESYLVCEEAMGMGTLLFEAPEGMVVRHTCTPAGEDL